MRALRAMLVLVPMLAFAGWHQAGTVVVPVSDVYLVDAGIVCATSSNAVTAWHLSDAGVSTQLNSLPGSYVGGGYFGTSCLLGLNSGGTITPSSGCGTSTFLAAGTWQHFRLLTGQPLGVAVVTTGALADAFWSGPGAAPGWLPQGTPQSGAGGSRSLETGHVGTVDFAVANSSNNGLRVSVDGGAPPTLVVTGTSGLRDAAVFPLAGAPAILGTLLTGGLALWRDYRTPVLVSPTIPTGTTARFVGISGVTGMATTAAGGLLSPVPDPNRPVEIWVARPTPPAESFTGIINCIDNRSCATANVATGVVWFWTNEVAPQVAVAVPQFDAGQTIRLVADAGDGDGDPVYVSWSVDGGTLVPVIGIDDGTQVDLTVSSGACGITSVDVTVTDGLPEHVRAIQVPITIIDRGVLQTDAGAATALAGGPAVDFTAAIVGGCAIGNLSWSTSDGQTGTGGQFSWTPPLTECTAGGRQVTVTTTASWASGVPATTSTNQAITILPWGGPTVPVFASPGAQASGSVRDWQSSSAEHACSTSSGFPGTELLWSFDAGAQYALPIDGGLRITAPPTCVPLRVSASARRQVIGETAGRVSAPAALTVDILPDTAPLGPTTPFSITVQGDGGLLFGDIDAGASCVDQRALVTEVTVSSGGTPVNSGRFPTPGAWQLSVPGGCAGGTYDVAAQLLEDAGFTGATAMGSVSLLYSPARVGALSVERVDVVCGVGAKAAVALVPVAESCGSVDLTWRSISGPELVTASGSGAALELQSQALDFSTVGQQIALEFVADAGPGNLDLATRTIELGVQPFLEASVRAQPPLRREEDPVSLEVTLHNTTACAVDGLSVVLPLSGGSPLLDSVLVDQVHARATQTDQGIVIEGVSVPASGRVLIQLSARAQLLNSPTVEPVASLRGYVVSSRPPTASPATGCGCSELASPALLGLALLVLRRRRRSTR